MHLFNCAVVISKIGIAIELRRIGVAGLYIEHVTGAVGVQKVVESIFIRIFIDYIYRVF